MTRSYAVALSVACVVACGRPSAGIIKSPTAPQSAETTEGVQLSLSLQVVDDPNALGLDAPKALRVTLESRMGSRDVVWVNGRLAASGGTAHGEIRLRLVGRSGPLEDRCLHNLHSAEPGDYVLLGPGEAISRVIKLSCYHPPSTQRLSATVTYQDVDPPPERAATAFRGKLTSNTVVFALREK